MGIDWSKAPKGAVEVVQRNSNITWCNKWGKIWCPVLYKWCDSVLKWDTVETRPELPKE